MICADDPGAHILGMNGKLNEIHAAMATLSLERVSDTIKSIIELNTIIIIKLYPVLRDYGCFLIWNPPQSDETTV